MFIPKVLKNCGEKNFLSIVVVFVVVVLESSGICPIERVRFDPLNLIFFSACLHQKWKTILGKEFPRHFLRLKKLFVLWFLSL